MKDEWLLQKQIDKLAKERVKRPFYSPRLLRGARWGPARPRRVRAPASDGQHVAGAEAASHLHGGELR
ncbi:hypothetical protein E2C01_053867 [Portunus trituberculatus]|uniref:Uncharacterized protein n=1 Tax=Portunus trituberculatus TaxID=210409 RepID=A0A5B7GQC3_PORTR|nr:hypothetical protein [Portunus trituberculatus]